MTSSNHRDRSEEAQPAIASGWPSGPPSSVRHVHLWEGWKGFWRVTIQEHNSTWLVLLEAQQRCFSYRTILATIVLQDSFALVFMGYRTNIARYVAKWGTAQMCLCETKYQGAGIAPFWGSANLSEKVFRDMGYRNGRIAISHDKGPLSHKDIRPKTF